MRKRIRFFKIWFPIDVFGSEMVKNGRAEKSKFLGLGHSLLMDLGQDQRQHSAVRNSGLCRRRVRGCDCWR